MELALNLLWLVVCVSAVRWWIREALARQMTNREALKGLVVLACALVVLFPVISASDDLCAMAAPIEDSFSVVRKVKLTFDGTTRVPAAILPLWTLLAIALGSVPLVRVAWTERLRPRCLSPFLISPRIGRSPPPVLVAF